MINLGRISDAKLFCPVSGPNANPEHNDTEGRKPLASPSNEAKVNT
jgi:hypothetical protein